MAVEVSNIPFEKAITSIHPKKFPLGGQGRTVVAPTLATPPVQSVKSQERPGMEELKIPTIPGTTVLCF